MTIVFDLNNSVLQSDVTIPVKEIHIFNFSDYCVKTKMINYLNYVGFT